MISSSTSEYYRNYHGIYLVNYLTSKKNQDSYLRIILSLFIATVLIATIIIAKPIFALEDTSKIKLAGTEEIIYIQKNFEENIKNKYPGSYINFPTQGIAHIKQVKYINSKPIKINVVEINTKVNPNLEIKPQIASNKLNSKTTVRKIAQKEQAIVAINGGFFKPQTGVPLGALMIDGEMLTGPIFNRVGIAIFNKGNKTEFKMDKIQLNLTAYAKNNVVKLDNINQPRMLSTHSLVYTPLWGEFSPIAPKYGYNMLVRDNKILKISANPIKMEKNDYVIQAPKEIISKLAKNNKEIRLEINTQEELSDADHIIGAGPYLIKNSEIYVDYKEQKLHAISGKNPRSAIGYKNDGTFIIVTIDGREKASVGMTLFELAKYMKSLGCEYAMNFDGGSSSAMYVNGKIVNSAINKEGIAVSNALVVSEYNPNEMHLTSLK